MSTVTVIKMPGFIKKYLAAYTDSATLAFFRLAFGFMMCGSMIRFAAYGWIDKFYIKPLIHFTYYGFSWVKPAGISVYFVFFICGLSAFFVAIGWKYRISMITFFITFAWIELMDKTTYLNHYYFISVITVILIFLPANAYFSVDARQDPKIAFEKIPRWNVDLLKLMLAIVYISAGVAKLNSDWLINAMPLKIWLPNNSNLPIFGAMLNKEWVIYAFSWLGILYDLTIVFLLIYKPTRWFAFGLVVIFHILTKILFPIGVFPYIMIIASLVFFDGNLHRRILGSIGKFIGIDMALFNNHRIKFQQNRLAETLKLSFISVFIIIQLLFPWRYLFYPGELFWTEEGFRFSWRVMLMEKIGYTHFIVVDPATNKQINVNNSRFLSAFQEKQMSFQPDFILEYSHFLHDHYEKNGILDPEVYAESYVALNGRLAKRFIDPNVNLAKENESFKHKTWILPFDDTIRGF